MPEKAGENRPVFQRVAETRFGSWVRQAPFNPSSDRQTIPDIAIEQFILTPSRQAMVGQHGPQGLTQQHVVW